MHFIVRWVNEDGYSCWTHVHADSLPAAKRAFYEGYRYVAHPTFEQVKPAPSAWDAALGRTHA